MRRLLGFASALLATLGAASALADPVTKAETGPESATVGAPAPPKSGEPDWENAPAERRSGFSMGISVGLGLGMAAGYPNDLQKINRERYYTEMPIGPGGNFTLWIGGALTDWLTFAAGFTGGSLSADDLDAGFDAIIFRTEVFPAWSLGGTWQEIGVGIDTGLGRGVVTPADDPDTLLVDSSAASRIGIGVFYDGLRVWRFSSGPFVSTDYAWSSTMRRGEVVLGWRTALYAGP